jgi:uncharacterized protein YqeY
MLEQMESDLKAAMLAGDKSTVETLKTLKSALQYEAVARSVKPGELNDEQVLAVIIRESKKRQEAAELYKNASETERADRELSEKAILDKYLPEQMDEDQLKGIVEAEIGELTEPSIRDMGKIIGAVRAQTGAAADGAVIARLVKEQLEQK